MSSRRRRSALRSRRRHRSRGCAASVSRGTRATRRPASSPRARALRSCRNGTPAAIIAAMDFEQIRYELADGVLTITLHRPDKLNAYTPTMQAELLQALDAADADDDVRVIL